ncbi:MULTISPECIES: ATP-grasp domain-containing protein [unclassified Kitasatospora]|uniref:ATP-grasp domain-containing protein n=1 Tax=unclassified Kitasatospora TaxID=2633591 RepID=UPI00340FC452
MTLRFGIVDGYSTGRFLVAQLRDYGAECVHVSSQPDMPAYFSAAHDPSNYVEDLGHDPDPRRVADRLRDLGVATVLPGTESGVLLADELTGLLGTPGHDPATSEARRCKPLMATTLLEAGVRAPLGLRVDSPGQARQWCVDRGITDAVVKPVDSAGSDNVHFCRTPDEVAEAAEQVLSARNLYGARNITALVQERVFGPEFYANSVSLDGEHKIAELWRYTKRVGDGMSPVYDYEEPVPVGSAEYRQVVDHVRRALTALGIGNGAAHTEVILTADGPVLIETGARLGGATLPWLVEKYCGVSQTRLLAMSLVDPAAFRSFDDTRVAWSEYVRNVSFINPVAGEVRSQAWRTELEALVSCSAVVSGVGVGHRLPVTTSLTSSPGFAYLASSDAADVYRDYGALREREEQGLYLN